MEILGRSYIAGIGAYLPSTRVRSDDLMAEVNCGRFGIPEDYISRYTGIIERRMINTGQQPSDLASLASESALRDAGAKADEIDLIIYTGITRDCEEPSTAHFVQNRLEAVNAACMDVSNACLGFMTGLSIADAYISRGAINTALICAGECQSNTMKDFMGLLTRTKDKDEFKRTFGVLTVGDAGGAMIVRPSDKPDAGWKWLNFLSNGSHAPLCYFKRDTSGVEGAMLMKEISREIVSMHAEQIAHTYQSIGWPSSSVEKLYCHQVGKKPHDHLAKVAQVDADRAPVTYKDFGNLTSATMPVNMYLNRPERDERIMFMGTGSGLTICQGAMIF